MRSVQCIASKGGGRPVRVTGGFARLFDRITIRAQCKKCSEVTFVKVGKKYVFIQSECGKILKKKTSDFLVMC